MSNGALLVTGHEPRTGKEIWRVRYRDDSTISSIVHGYGLLFVNTGGPPGGSRLWAIREGGAGDVTDSHVVWKMTEDPPHQSSPVLVDDLPYTVSDRGVLICMEAATGERAWPKRVGGNFGASLLSAPGRIYLSDMGGTTTGIASGREYWELAVNQLDGELCASPAVTGNSLLLRTKSHRYRIEETDWRKPPRTRLELADSKRGRRRGMKRYGLTVIAANANCKSTTKQVETRKRAYWIGR